MATGEERLSIVPNPFHHRVAIRYHAPVNTSDAISLRIFNAAGQVVREFNETPANTDALSLVWDGTDEKGRTLPQGIYFVNLEFGDNVQTEKVIFIR
jgi:flagellar hook assembly protein FlgD